MKKFYNLVPGLQDLQLNKAQEQVAFPKSPLNVSMDGCKDRWTNLF